MAPPLIRSEVWKLKSTSRSDDFILVYMTQPSMLNDLVKWHNNNREIIIHCFIGGDFPTPYTSSNLYFHKIDGDKFLRMMSVCSGLVTTAGFESVCEAMAFEKPVMMIPLKNHFEQACNAVDAEISGAGILGTTFNLTPFLKYILERTNESSNIQHWFERADDKIFNEFFGNQNYKIEKIYERYEFEDGELQPI